MELNDWKRNMLKPEALHHTFKDCDCQKPKGESTNKRECLRKAPTYLPTNLTGIATNLPTWEKKIVST